VRPSTSPCLTSGASVCRCEHAPGGWAAYSHGMGKWFTDFRTRACVDTAGVSGDIVEYARAEVIFSRGDACDSILYIQHGGVTLSAFSRAGAHAVVATLGPGTFFGEECLAGQAVRFRSATAITPSSVLTIDKRHMARVLHRHDALSTLFIGQLLSRQVRIEQELIDQLLNCN
jgi:CRP/FNR family cyclic AMP-dependent transcriptional regulator